MLLQILGSSRSWRTQATFDVPTVILSLVDDDRHSIKCAIGTHVDLKEIPRDGSLPFEGEEPFVTDHYPSTEHPISSAEGPVRFYAGCPIIVSGVRAGTHSVLDTVPRTLSAQQTDRLKGLARWVQLELQDEASHQAVEEGMIVKELYEALFEGSFRGLAVFSMAGIFENANALAREFLDLPAKPPPIFSLADVLGSVRAEEALQRGSEGQVYLIEPFEFHESNPPAILQIILKPLFIRDLPSKLIMSIEDITEAVEVAANQRRLLKEAVAAKEKAIIARQERERFMAVLAHEMRNSLSGIFSITELLRDNPESATPETLSHLTTCSLMLGSLIDDTLDLERMDQGRLKLDIQTFDLGELISTEVDLRRAEATALDVGLSYKTSKEVGLVRGDELRLRQILANLLTNAIKYSPKGYVQVECSLRAGRYRIKVSDTGVGITEEDMATIFEPYFQVSRNASESIRGIGLGLSIVKSLVSLMKGTMGAESVPGQGSTFWVSLELPNALATQRDDEPRRFSGRVLIVDDNAINRRILELQLASLGASVALAANGREALSLLEDHSFDLVFMDCHMPVMDGYETTRRIRAEADLYGAPTIIALTASSTDRSRQRCLKAGMDDFLRKPIRHLHRRLSVYLSSEKEPG